MSRTERVSRLALLLFAGSYLACSGSAPAPASGDGSLVWVSADYSGGRQCAPREDYSPPDTRRVLEEAGVTVEDTAILDHVVCSSCECPAYAATHYALVPTSDLASADSAGFARAEEPPADATSTGSGVDTQAVDTAAGPVAFRGLGQEPGWMLDIVPGEHIHFRYDYGEREVSLPVPDPETTRDRTIYHATTDAHDLRVEIRHTACTDVMSGQSFESTVTVTLDGQEYHGCGRRR
ncbi:MAG TPA: hypothetical protein VJ925_13245 [Longimicrobiales bacterium]|nr:hypothetical protein [Longimicrobiales bacterium]